MKLYSGKIPVIGTELVRSLMADGDISVVDKGEAELDVQAVLKEYLRLDKEITEKAKDLLQKRNLPYEQFGKVKRTLAGEKGFGLGDDGLDWMTTQMIESLMQSPHVEEVYAEDSVLRRKMTDIFIDKKTRVITTGGFMHEEIRLNQVMQAVEKLVRTVVHLARDRSPAPPPETAAAGGRPATPGRGSA